MILGTVHGDKIDGHFFQTWSEYMQAQIHNEHNRMSEALREAAGHIEDADLAAKYIDIAESRPHQWGCLNIRSGPLLSMGRGRQCQEFLNRTDDEWLFCTDTDMVWESTLPQQMIELAEKGATLEDGTVERIQILAAPAWICWTAPDGTIESRNPNIYKGFTDDTGQFWLAGMAAEELANPGLYKVGACGGALMLLHRDALTTIRDQVCGGEPHWWHHLPTPPMKQWGGQPVYDQYGEDTSFCLRARQAGLPIWVHSGIKLGHSKTVVQY